jgi:hypothetical protein
MNVRSSRWATGILVLAAVALLPGVSWAVFYALGPSKDEWGLKYEVEVSAADGDQLSVLFTLADQGRLKPIYSATVIAFSNPDRDGARSYLAKAPIDLKPATGGKLAGQALLPKQFADRALIRILTLTFDGQRHSSASYYDIPLKKFLKRPTVAASPLAPPSLASPPTSKVTK